MKKILVPTDFSNCSNAALKVAASIAKKNDAEIEILHVIESPEFHYPTLDFNAIPVGYFAQIKKELFDQADKKLKKLEETAHMYGVKIGAHVEEGLMYQVLEDLTKSGSFDLIVLGTKGASGLEEALIGSNAQKVVRHSDVPVLTVSHNDDNFDLKNIVVASDFREIEKMQKDLLHRLLTNPELDVHLLGVTTPLEPEDKETVLARAHEFAIKCSLDDYETAVIYKKDVTDAIVDYGKNIKADMILMYTHGYSGIKSWFHSSIAEAVVNHSDIPVMTLRFND